ncbi:MAG TPA: amino acid racemase [Anaeromyxobacter sp.]
MKRIGLVGGIGPESTLDYYRRLVAAFALQSGSPAPELVIYSARVQELFELMAARDWDGLVAWLLAKIEALRAAGADFGAIGANTPHVVFERVQARSPLPLRSIVEATCLEAQRLRARRLGLLGTRFTMQSDFFQRSFGAAGLELVVPGDGEQRLIHERLMTEIELGVIKDSTRQELLGIVRRMIDASGIDAVILGCTELPLILDRSEFGLPFLNTTAIHVDDLVRYATA